MKYFLLLVVLSSCSTSNIYGFDENELSSRYKSENSALREYRSAMIEVIREDLNSYNKNHNSTPSYKEPF